METVIHSGNSITLIFNTDGNVWENVGGNLDSPFIFEIYNDISKGLNYKIYNKHSGKIEFNSADYLPKNKAFNADVRVSCHVILMIRTKNA